MGGEEHGSKGDERDEGPHDAGVYHGTARPSGRYCRAGLRRSVGASRCARVGGGGCCSARKASCAPMNAEVVTVPEPVAREGS